MIQQISVGGVTHFITFLPPITGKEECTGSTNFSTRTIGVNNTLSAFDTLTTLYYQVMQTMLYRNGYDIDCEPMLEALSHGLAGMTLQDNWRDMLETYVCDYEVENVCLQEMR